MKCIILDYFWITIIIIVNVLIFIRKGILTKYGYCFHLLDLLLDDRKKLANVIKNTNDIKKKKYYILVNRAIPILFITGILLCIISILIKNNIIGFNN